MSDGAERPLPRAPPQTLRWWLSSGLSIVWLVACNQFGETLDMHAERPANGSYWNVTWLLLARATGESVSCTKAGAKFVLATIRPQDAASARKKYRAPCDRPGAGGFIPLEQGNYRVSAQLVDGRGRPIATIPEYALDVSPPGGDRRTPFLFRVP